MMFQNKPWDVVLVITILLLTHWTQWVLFCRPGESLNELTHQNWGQSDQLFVCKCKDSAPQINRPGNGENLAEHEKKLIRPGRSHDELAHQIWAKSEMWFVCKCTETAWPRDNEDSVECDQKLIRPGARPTKHISIEFNENSECSSFEYTRPITTIFCTRHDSDTVVTCAKYRCDRPRIVNTRLFWIFIEFRIRSKYA